MDDRSLDHRCMCHSHNSPPRRGPFLDPCAGALQKPGNALSAMIVEIRITDPACEAFRLFLVNFGDRASRPIAVVKLAQFRILLAIERQAFGCLAGRTHRADPGRIGTQVEPDLAHSGEGPLVFTPQGREELYKSCRRLDSRLAALIEEPITGKVVDHLLGISAAERRRWSKDGRLTPCGSRTSRRGRARFNFPIFSLNRIEMLRNEPELIERWREQDEARKLPGSGFVLESTFDHIWT